MAVHTNYQMVKRVHPHVGSNPQGVGGGTRDSTDHWSVHPYRPYTLKYVFISKPYCLRNKQLEGHSARAQMFHTTKFYQLTIKVSPLPQGSDAILKYLGYQGTDPWPHFGHRPQRSWCPMNSSHTTHIKKNFKVNGLLWSFLSTQFKKTLWTIESMWKNEDNETRQDLVHPSV